MTEGRIAQLCGLALVVEGILQAVPSDELEAVQRYVQSQHTPPLEIAASQSMLGEWRSAQDAVFQACGIVACAIRIKR